MANHWYKVYVSDGALSENDVADMLTKAGVASQVDKIQRSTGLVQARFSSKKSAGKITGAVIECLTDVPSWKVKVLPADVCEKAVVRVSNEWHKEIAAHRVKLNPLLSRGVDVKETPQELTLEGNWESVCEALEMIELQLVEKWKESSAKMEKDAQLSGIKSITDPTARDYNDDDNASHQKRADDSSGVAASNVMAGHSVTHTVTGRQNPVDTAVKINQVREIDECVWTYIKAKFADMASYFETKLSPVGIDRTGKIQLSGQLQELNLFDEFYQQHRLELVVEITVKLPMYWGKAAAKDMAGELDVVTYDVSSTNDNSFKGIGRKDDLANFMKFLNDSVPSGDVSQGSNQLPTAKGVAQSMAGGNSSARSSPPAARLVRHTGDSLMLETPSAHLTVSIMKGDLTKLRVEVIVNPANSLLQHHGGAAKAIADAAGYEMRWACEDYIKKHHKLPVSEVMDTTAGYLYPSIKRIIHVCGPKYKNYQDDTECKKHLERTFHNCLVHANDNLFAKSMAIPAVSAGTFGCPWDMVTTAAYNALMSFDSYMASLLPRQRHLASIYFVNIDREITLAFVDMFSELIKSDVNASSVPSYEANDKNGSIPVVGQRLPNVDGTGKDPAKCCVCGRVKSLTKKDCGHKACVSCKFKSCLKCAQSRAVPGGSKRTPADDTTTVTARPKSSLDVGKSGTANGSAVKGDGSSFNRKRSGSFSGAIGRSVAGSKATTKSAANGDSPDVDSSKDDDNFDLNDSTPSPLRRTNSLTLHDRKKPADGAASGGSTSGEMCAICMDEIKNSKKLECGHKFCTDCINVALKHSSKCPCCGQIVGKLVGNQPDGGTMKVRTSLQDLPGFSGAGSIEITYDIPSGFQQDNHPNPGRPFRGTQRVAYLPNNSEGNEILKLLREAFKARLVFTVGRSATTGEENVVVWNDIHHKTSRTGQYGYPDYTYLTRVKMELAAKGIGVKGASPAAAVPPVSVDDPAGATGRPLPPRTAWTNPTSGSDTTPRSSFTSRSNSGSPHSPSLSKRSTAAAAVTTCYSSSRPTSSATKTSSVKGTTASTTSTASSLAGGSLSSAGFATSYPLTSTRLSSATDLTRRDDFTSPLTSSLTRYPEDRYDYRTSGSSSSQSYLSLPNHSHDDHKNAVNVRVERHHTGSGSRGSSHLGDKGSDYDLRRYVHSSRSSGKPTSTSSAGGSVYGGVMSSVSSRSTQSPAAGYGSAYLGSSSSYSDGRSSRPFTTGVGYDSSVSRGGVYDTHGRLDFRGSSR